ncbi:hypothetical protein BO82DRAFT_7916 [Aspergillus uvarum CBS 121591]|uniref:Uncharacterized protein n=1 Tax=Aspergillus uvarum CBS 121591 TaxID=1448315 RepID=A0A319D9B4_9EURO|nr:hypothetical protein BO82DRAFT_7916 [Aspergillus uvarum CBS 121591]PYH84578.1 hypothetical protein BO82DRAFT_7916 [Aspergillus uvarum CBS 121591]
MYVRPAGSTVFANPNSMQQRNAGQVRSRLVSAPILRPQSPKPSTRTDLLLSPTGPAPSNFPSPVTSSCQPGQYRGPHGHECVGPAPSVAFI